MVMFFFNVHCSFGGEMDLFFHKISHPLQIVSGVLHGV